MNQMYYEPEVKIYKKDKIIDISKYVEGIIITKSINKPAAAFSITLNPSITLKGGLTISTSAIFNKLKSQIELNDIIAGKFNSQSKKYSFLGFVSNQYESSSQLNNQTSRSIVIDGSFLLPKLLIKDNIVHAPQLAVMPEITSDPVLGERAKFFAWTRGDYTVIENELYPKISNYIDNVNPAPHPVGKGSVFVNTPQKIVEWILNECVATNTQLLGGLNAMSFFPGPKSNILDMNKKPILDFQFLTGEYIYGEALSQYTGSLINYIYECLDRDFYELFFDTGTRSDGLPCNTMTIRTRPFTHKDVDQSSFFKNWSYWEDLPTTTLKKSDILKKNVGISDYELKNYFAVNYRKSMFSTVLSEFGVNFPILNINSIKKYGLRSLEVQSTIVADISNLRNEHNKSVDENNAELLVSMAQKNKEPLFKGLLDKRDKIKEWYAFPFFESGNLTTVLNDEITIGSRVELPEHEYYSPLEKKIYKGCKFYVNEVKHTFKWGSIPTTQIGVTRGHPDGIVKKWFDHPDNKFTTTPLELKPETNIKIKTDPPEFYDKVFEINSQITNIEEVE